MTFTPCCAAGTALLGVAHTYDMPPRHVLENPPRDMLLPDLFKTVGGDVENTTAPVSFGEILDWLVTKYRRVWQV